MTEVNRELRDSRAISNIVTNLNSRMRPEGIVPSRSDQSGLYNRTASPGPGQSAIPRDYATISDITSSHIQPQQMTMNKDGEYVMSNEVYATSNSSTADRSYHEQIQHDEDSSNQLPPLQVMGQTDDNDSMEPFHNEDEYESGSYDLLAPAPESAQRFSLEAQSEILFSAEHLRMIFDDSNQLLRFTAFLNHNRPSSVPLLIYYLDSIKALRAIKYANAIVASLDRVPGFDGSNEIAPHTVNTALEQKANLAFEALVKDDLPAYITHAWTSTVSSAIARRISGTLPIHLRETSEGLAEVFCLTDPSRPDNPIVFASEEFHRTTQYGMGYVIGRNCRFLQGPKTNPNSVRRIRERVLAGEESCEVFLNYRRDGSPFMNLLMTAPLSDSRGKIRYFIGAQVDVSGLLKGCSDLEALQQLFNKDKATKEQKEYQARKAAEAQDEFRDLAEMLNSHELDTVQIHGGKMHKENLQDTPSLDSGNRSNGNPRLVLNQNGEDDKSISESPKISRFSGKLSGVYEHYLLVRPYPSLRILFASPSMRVPGILQSPFMARIGGSARVREELTQALADGRGVTAKVRWVTKTDIEGRNRWIHCTPLLGVNSAIGVWMIVVVDDDRDTVGRRLRQAPAVEKRDGRKTAPLSAGSNFITRRQSNAGSSEVMSLQEFAMHNSMERLRINPSQQGERVDEPMKSSGSQESFVSQDSGGERTESLSYSLK